MVNWSCWISQASPVPGAIRLEIAHYRNEDVFSWTRCFKIFMPCLWLYKVFCCVGPPLSKMFPDENCFPRGSIRQALKTALQTKPPSGLMPEYKWIMHDLTLKEDLTWIEFLRCIINSFILMRDRASKDLSCLGYCLFHFNSFPALSGGMSTCLGLQIGCVLHVFPL